MSFPRYPDVKDGEVAWLGEVPVHWDVRRLGYFFDERREKVSDKDFEPLSVTKNGVVPQLETAAKTDDNDNRKKVCRGDFVINSRSDRKGSAGVSERDGSVSLINTVLAPRVEVHGSFAHHLLRSVAFQEEFYRWGKGIVADLWSTNFTEMRSILICVPPLDEQSAIAAFLDRETGKIDALVAEQEKLIELLKEKRQAVISHAVTKGLDPTVPMKDSGIEWLGEVPAHWSLSRVKHLCSHVVDCLHTTPTYDGELEYPAIRTADVERGVLKLEQARLVSREVYEERIQRLCPIADDILYSREGERFGMAALVPEGIDLCLGQRMMMFRTLCSVDAAFTMWLLNSDAVYQQVLEKVGGSTSPHVNISDIINFHVAMPPLPEQRSIAAHIARETAAVDALVTEAQRAIDLLKERRSALISAAVTGKIDVRGLVAVAETEAA